ncbi:hypothetical protein C7S18_02615 [Ahniella affigens]|uniref:Thioredoxin-like fold domain-containing protein n=1 Tax=Ahniella affigens TaxID=2021234 RepID=A0A2P1PMU4_9GAMM|nr:thioredoxin domain-containing protein [Ahniella affigens]AVP96152.1 hypothetical protein C7S18_02615 [Ahniella affigens]
MFVRLLLLLLLGLVASIGRAQSLTPDVQSPEVAVVVFSSYACPYCAAWAKDLDQIVQQHPGRVALMVVPYPLDPDREARIIAFADEAARQGAFRYVHPMLFELASGRLSEAAFRTRAEMVGVDLRDFDPARADATESRNAATVQAKAMGVRVAPTTFVNGMRFEGLPSRAAFETVVQSALMQQEPTASGQSQQK